VTVDLLALHSTFEGVPSAFASARDSIDVVLRDRGFRRTTPADTSEALLRGALASAELTHDHAGAGSAETDAVRVSAMLLGQLATFRQTPLQALAHVHAVAAAALAEDQRGRPRDADAARLLQGLAQILRTNSSAPALVVAAVVHAEIASGEPFGSHNGIVARAAERLTLVARGVDPASVLVPEAGHLALRSAYADALAGYRVGEGLAGKGVGVWWRYAASAYVAGLDASPLHANGTRNDSDAAAHT
jgi:hypothetical protein